MSLEKEFIPYSQAKTLKKLGFNEKCFTSYDDEKRLRNPFDCEEDFKNNVSYIEDTTCFVKNSELMSKDWVTTPTYSQVFKWFRIEHGLYSSINPKKLFPDGRVTGVEWNVNICGGDGNEIGPNGTYTYDKAQLECLKKLIDIVKNK